MVSVWMVALDDHSQKLILVCVRSMFSVLCVLSLLSFVISSFFISLFLSLTEQERLRNSVGCGFKEKDGSLPCPDYMPSFMEVRR